MKVALSFLITCLVAWSATATENWTVKAPMPAPRNSAGVVAIDNYIYVAGGGSASGATNTLFAYNVYTDTWTTKASMSAARAGFQAVTVNGKIYAIGGFNGGALNIVEEYNPATNTWTTKAPIPTSRSQFSAAVLGNKIYVCGGWIGSYTTLEVYDPATNTWATQAPMSYGKIQDGGGTAMGGKFYFLGGKNYANSTYYDSCSIYISSTDSWTVGPNMPHARFSGGVTYLKGRIYYMCGSEGGPVVPNFRDNMWLDSATNTWHTALPCLVKRAACAVVVGKNNRIYLIGGVDSTGSNTLNYNHEYFNDTLMGIDDTITITLSTGAIENKAGNEKMTIYPNPCQESFSIAMPQGADPIDNIYIIDITGQIVTIPGITTSGKTKVNTNELPRGIYTVVAATASKHYTTTLVVN